MKWQEKYKDKLITCAQAAALIKSGDKVFSPMGGGLPYLFYEALADVAMDLEDVMVTFGGLSKPLRICEPQFNGHVSKRCFFMGRYERAYIADGADVSYIPTHFSDIARFILSHHHGKVLALTGSVPDEDGMISSGASPIDATMIADADLVILQVNKNQPFVRGEGTMVSADQVNYLIDGEDNIIQPKSLRVISDVDWKISEYIAERIPDGACLQFGVGAVSATMGKLLENKKDLGIHSELFCESMVDLIMCGAVNNSRKNICRGKSIFGFCTRNERVLEFIDHNPDVESRPYYWVNDPRVIGQIDNMVSVNAAMQIDLTGQVSAESIGLREYSGTGGQADFMRGTKWSNGGMSLIAFPSTRVDKKTGESHSKITLTLPVGSAVTSPKSDVQFIVTEYGVADLRSASIAQRARSLISISAPEFREQLTAEAKKAGLII